LNLLPLGDNLLGVQIINVQINSLNLPVNNILSSLLLNAITFSNNLNLDVSAYGNLKSLFVDNFTGINVLNLESALLLQQVTFNGTVQNLALANWSIGNLIFPNLNSFNLTNATKITSVGNIKTNVLGFCGINITSTSNLTSIGDIRNMLGNVEPFILFNQNLLSVGDMDLLPNSNVISVAFNPALISIGSLAGASSVGFLNMGGNTSLTTIGSMAGLTNCTQYNLDNNALNSATVSQILVDIDGSGVLNGLLFIDGGTNAGVGALTVAGATAYANLLGNGWAISINP
jgi:hypothetical protein